MHLALGSFNKALNGVILMSSTLLLAFWGKGLGLDILQSHGTEDPVLPFNGLDAGRKFGFFGAS